MKKRINPFAEKRVKTFSSLKTKPTDWVHAKVKTFTPFHKQRKSGIPILKWIPVYHIPDGYTNPFDRDADMTENKRCQICDTKIIEHGIITCEKTKQFLIVGKECYVVYESDSDKSETESAPLS